MRVIHKTKITLAICAAFSLSACSSTAHQTIDVTANQVTTTQPFDAAIKNNSLAINETETLAVASISSESAIKIYNLTSKQLITSLTGYVTPRNIQFAADGKSFYISDSSLCIVRQVTTNEFKTIREIAIGQGAFGFAIYKDEMFVNNEAANTVSVVNLQSGKIKLTLDGFNEPRQGIKVGPSGRYVYVTNFKGDDVRVIDTQSWQIVKTLTGVPGVRAISISPDESKLYGASSASNSLRIISIKNNQLLQSIPTGNEPYGAALSSDGGTIVVGNKEDNTVQVFDVRNYALIRTISGLNEPRQAIIYSKTSGKLFVLQKDLSIAIVNYENNHPLTIIK